jgi:uncharacterized protein (TIGR02246 family)
MQEIRLIYCIPIALMLAGCGASDTRQADGQTLKEDEARWNQEYAAKNVDKIVEHYTDNAILMGTGMPSSSGKAEIRKMVTEMVADPALSLQFQPARVEVAKAGDMAYTQGTYQMTMTVPGSKQVVHDHGSYVTTYAKQPDGSWKAVADIATSETSPSGPPSPAASK